MDADRFRAAEQRWRERVPASQRAVEWREGLDVQALYTPLDLAGLDHDQDIGLPGEFPFTRGVHASMYRGRPWTVRQYAGYGAAEDANVRFRYLLERGQSGLSVAFDLPTQVGLDSDDPEAEDEVGRVGVAIDTLEDFDGLFREIPLDRVTVSFTINSTAPVILAMLVALAERRGIPPDCLGGTLQNDTLKEFIARGTWIFPIAPSLRLTTDVIEYSARHLPRFNPISITGAHMKEAGADVVQELGYTFADAVTYVRSVLARGLDVDAFATRLSFATLTGPDFFVEIAKFRAARRLWARIMTEWFHARDPRSLMYRVFSGVVCRALTREFPLNNIFRIGAMGLANVLGGVQALSLAGYDEVYSLPSEESARIALHTQHILGHELGVTRVVDPLAGSYFVESLTAQIAARVWTLLESIEAQGGMVALIEQGVVQRAIAARAYEEEKRIATGEIALVGSNLFREDGSTPPFHIQRADPSLQARQCERLRDHRRRRDGHAVAAALKRVEEAAGASENLVPHLVAAVRHGATVGETTRTLRAVFGEYREVVTL